MIFTRRFGALAARPDFHHLAETAQEPDVNVRSTEAELEAMTADVESESVYVASR